jgi:thiosulfate/3-mercaptopyruvate sulfurtransferase
MAYETLIDRDTVQAHLDDPRWRIVDCRFDLNDTERGRRAYDQAHLPNSLYAHLDEDLSGPITPAAGRHPLPDLGGFVQTLRRWGVDQETQVVVYDDTLGSIAVRLWWMLRYLGHKAAALMDGGFPLWSEEGRPLTDKVPHQKPSLFVSGSALAGVVDTPQLERELRAETSTVLDARAADRFRGEIEPIDPVAGHIPGALNRPFTLNLTASGEFLPPQLLREIFRHQLGDHEPRRVVHMCGSGVTACHNLLAMDYAGLPGSRLYVGSWSEWIRDPARPVEKSI